MIRVLDEKYESKIRILIKEIPKIIENFNKWGYRKNLDFYLYRLIISTIKANELVNILKKKKGEEFIALAYSTLISWDMDKRRAKIKPFNEFRKNILENQNLFLKLTNFELIEINSHASFLKIKEIVKKLYKNLNLMEGESRLVSNSKIMHYFLPDLIMPMDGKNTLRFFSTYENPKKVDTFLNVFECSWRIAVVSHLEKYIDNEWNTGVPKIIDNAIIYLMYRDKHEFNRIIKGIEIFLVKLGKKKVPNSISAQLKKDLNTVFKEYHSKL